MIFGDGSAGRIYPPPKYDFMRMWDYKPYQAENRLAADYAQIYFPSQKFEALSENYEQGVYDPFSRSSRYAPFLHYICSISFCKLEYGYASFLHMLIQLLLFFGAFSASFKILDIEYNFGAGFLLAVVLLFVTPAGISWYERGQFSLYVALAHLLLIVGLFKNKPILVVVSAFFAYVKWTSFTLVFVIFTADLLASKNSGEFIRKMKVIAAYALVLALLSLPFLKEFPFFLAGLFYQELHIAAYGVSLNHLLSPSFSKIAFLLVILMGYVLARVKHLSFENLLPFFAGAGIFSLIYPRVAYEYNIPNLFAFIPLLFAWAKQGDSIRHILKFIFFFFMIFISYYSVFIFIQNIALLVLAYLLISALFIFSPLLFHSSKIGAKAS
jgi:hypothetical protein